jgi:hypothetical protein
MAAKPFVAPRNASMSVGFSGKLIRSMAMQLILLKASSPGTRAKGKLGIF